MSVDGKVRALSKLLRDNFGFVMQGVGVVVPIFATYDANSKPEARLYFYDAMGAQFEVTDYAATGSGSPAVRGILYYENNWGSKKLHELNQDEAVAIALRALDTAAEADTATGGVDRSGKIYPLMKLSRTTESRRCGKKKLRPSSNKAWHDRRTVPLGGSDREPSRVHRDAAGAGKSDRRGRLCRWNSFADDWAPVATKAFRDLRPYCDGGDRSSGDIERLRLAAIELASTEGFTRSAADVRCAGSRIIRLAR